MGMAQKFAMVGAAFGLGGAAIITTGAEGRGLAGTIIVAGPLVFGVVGFVIGAVIDSLS